MSDEQRTAKKPSGWKDGGGMFWIKSSKHGQMYRCKECAREALGYSGANDYRHHWPKCSHRVEAK
jgi:hypothetical protein